ncbi:MAG TPA: hypothetical protein PKD64_19635 [Pirellulaceae bacterium]|nr:hypothetical protein [Pirellulaceae bacterium]HMO94404.1 hypothetical protein [Pirellulaceae bacterium]HMP71503.1 hypothetical protein [Pirellulaceae bacterium]
MFIRFAVVSLTALVALVITSDNASAQQYSVIKNTSNTIFHYQVSFKSPYQGGQWSKTFTLNPGQGHIWKVTDPNNSPIWIRFDSVVGDNQFTAGHAKLPSSRAGHLSTVWVIQRSVRINTTGNGR